MRNITLSMTLLSLLCAAGCGSVYLTDDIMLDLRFSALPSDTLHAPYVPGTRVHISVRSTRDNEKMDGWTLESADPGLLEVHSSVQDHHLSADCLTRAEGRATLIVRDGNGGEVHRSTVSIEQPDRAELFAHGPMIINRPEGALQQAQVLAGGEGTFLCEYSRGDHRVYGNGVLSAAAPGTGVVAQPRTSFLLINREWLSVTAARDATGDVPIALSANGKPLGTFTVHVAAEGDIDRLALAGEDESHARKDETLAVLVESFDRGARAIYGVESSFLLAGAMQTGTGDLYRYTYDPDRPAMLTAVHGGLRASAMLHTGMGYVTSTNAIGCQAAPGRPGRAPNLPALLCAGLCAGLLGLLRRRRLLGTRTDPQSRPSSCSLTSPAKSR